MDRFAVSEDSGSDAASSQSESSGSYRQASADGSADHYRGERETAAAPKSQDIGQLLGIDARGRTSSFQLLSTCELTGTGSVEVEGRLTISTGSYFSDRSNLNLLSSRDGPLATALRPASSVSSSITDGERAAMLAHVSGQKAAKSNEGRAEVFFGGAGKVVATAAAAFATGAVGRVANVSTTALAGSAGAGFTLFGQVIEVTGREAGEALGRWIDPRVEQYKAREHYDSRIDPRFNPWGWTFD